MNETNDTHDPVKLDRCTSKRVLIIDDEKSIREVFMAVLAVRLPDCRIDAAINGAEGIRIFSEIHHKVIVLDLNMPVMNGADTFREIQHICEKVHWDMPSIVFCTGYDPPQLLRNILMESQKHILLYKPVTTDVLTNAIRSRL